MSITLNDKAKTLRLILPEPSYPFYSGYTTMRHLKLYTTINTIFMQVSVKDGLHDSTQSNSSHV